MFGNDALEKRAYAIDAAGNLRAEAIQILRSRRWLQELRLRFELSLEILDTDLGHLFQGAAGPGDLRAAMQGIAAPTLREHVAGVIRSAKAKTITAGDFRVRLSPLFVRAGETPVPIGVVVIGDTLAGHHRASAESIDAADRRLDIASQWLVAAIEAELDATLKDVSDGRDVQRLAGGLDVVEALTHLETDREIIALVMEAVALWYDADVYAYRQDLSGAFVYYACLPGGDSERVPKQLPGHHIWARGEVFSPESRVELDELGWPVSMGHTLFVPIVVDRSTECLLAVSDVRDDVGIRQTLGLLSHIAALLLSDQQRRAVERLQRRLSSLLLFSDAPFHATARLAFEAVAAEADASSVQFTVFQQHGGNEKPVLSLQWGGADTDLAPFVEADTTSLAPASIAVGISAGSDTTVVLSLKRASGAFAPVVQKLARSAASMLGIWLSGSLLGSIELRVPEAGEYGAELVQRLRKQVDRFGHVRISGALAVILPQAQTATGHTLDEAVDLLEHHVRPSDVIGAVGSAGAGVLLPDATRDVATAVVGRLLHAAREKGLVAVRVGVAMFAAASESPEAVLERALMNARRGSV